MPKYTFNLHSFTINNRRTNHPLGGGTDTVKIAAALQVGDHVYPALYRGAGNLGDTGKEYVQDLAFRDVEIRDPNVPVKFSFVITNSGHQDENQVRDVVTKGANYLVGLAVASIPQTGIWGVVATGASALAKYLIQELASIFDANCDGLVASDAFAFRAGDLLKATRNGPWHSVRDYPGMKSPHGCGGNSNYRVDCSIAQTSQAAKFGGLWTPGNDGYQVVYGDAWDYFNGHRVPDLAKSDLRPVQVWQMPWSETNWGGLFRSGGDAYMIEYGDSYDYFNNQRVKDAQAQGLGPTYIHIRQWAGDTRYAAVFRSNAGPCQIVYGDSYDHFMNQRIPELGAKGLTPVQVWHLWADDGGSHFGGLFRQDPRPWQLAWGDSYDHFNNVRLKGARAQGMIPTQVLLSWDGPDFRPGALFRKAPGPFSIAWGDDYGYFDGTRIDQTSTQGMRLSQFWASV